MVSARLSAKPPRECVARPLGAFAACTSAVDLVEVTTTTLEQLRTRTQTPTLTSLGGVARLLVHVVERKARLAGQRKLGQRQVGQLLGGGRAAGGAGNHLEAFDQVERQVDNVTIGVALDLVAGEEHVRSKVVDRLVDDVQAGRVLLPQVLLAQVSNWSAEFGSEAEQRHVAHLLVAFERRVIDRGHLQQ